MAGTVAAFAAVFAIGAAAACAAKAAAFAIGVAAAGVAAAGVAVTGIAAAGSIADFTTGVTAASAAAAGTAATLTGVAVAGTVAAFAAGIAVAGSVAAGTSDAGAAVADWMAGAQRFLSVDAFAGAAVLIERPPESTAGAAAAATGASRASAASAAVELSPDPRLSDDAFRAGVSIERSSELAAAISWAGCADSDGDDGGWSASGCH